MDTTDAEVLEACARGDRDALRELYHRYNRAVFSWCARVLDSPGRAADATEAVFVAAWDEASGWDRQVPVTSWLFDLARRATGDMAPDPDLDAVWLGGKAATSLAALPLRQAEALRLVRHERRSIEEAARILGVDEAEARRIVFDGLAALKEALEDQRAAP